MASARLGCDLVSCPHLSFRLARRTHPLTQNPQSHVICEPSAAPTIKSYSPNLMVHPLLRSTASIKPTSQPDHPNPEDPSGHVSPILEMLPRLHVLVIGPGLGRDEYTYKMVTLILREARRQNLSFVLDADGLNLVQQDPELIAGYKDCILTPNVVEFARLANAMHVPTDDGTPPEELCGKLARKLGGVTIVQKGQVDYISNGPETLVSDGQGGLKRSGGQGDTLTGSLGTFLAWREAYHEGLWDTKEKTKMARDETLRVVAWAGSAITRECSRRAFAKKGRSLQASDLTEEVHGSFLALVGEPEGDEVESKL